MVSVAGMKHLLNLTCNKHKAEMVNMVDEKAKLSEENKELRKTVANLNDKINSLTWKSFRKPNQRSSVLVGNDLIQNVSDEMLEDTDVICN